MKNFINYILTLIISLAIFSTSLIAEEYNLHIDDIDAQCDNFGLDPSLLGNKDIKINYVDLTYDDVNELLFVEVQTDNSRGQISNSFHMVLSGGERAKGFAHLTNLYFDATKSLANPIVSIYGYNARASIVSCDGEDCAIDYCGNIVGSYVSANCNADGSYGPLPDRIVSNYSETTNFSSDVYYASGSETTDGGLITRTFNLIISTKNINIHTPLMHILGHNPPYSYDGVQFKDNVGVLFWAGSNVTTNYWLNNGFLRTYEIPNCAVCDDVFETKRKPKCVSTNVTQSPVEVGKQTTMTINVKSFDVNDTKKVDTRVKYDKTLPSGAKPTVAENGIVNFDADGNGVVSIEWIPSLGQEGKKYIIDAKFHVDYGLGQLVSESCPVEVEVVAGVSECKKASADLVTRADQDAGRIAGLAKDLKTRVETMYKKLGMNKKIDNFNQDDAHITAWQSYWAIAQNGDYFFECTGTEFCSGGVKIENIQTQIDTFDSALDELYNIAISRTKKFQRAKAKILISKGIDKSKARARAKRQTKRLWLDGRNRTGIEPAYASAKNQMEQHEATYGTLRYTCNGAKTTI